MKFRSKCDETPLHLALKFSHLCVAALLQRYGASLDIDKSVHGALSYCHSVFNDVRSTTLETLVWGSNKNYNLGLGDVEGRDMPQQLEYFKKSDSSVLDVAISSFHCIYLDEKHQLHVVGHGNEFQLGLCS